jgi:Ca-activated chloride channel family protein
MFLELAIHSREIVTSAISPCACLKEGPPMIRLASGFLSICLLASLGSVSAQEQEPTSPPTFRGAGELVRVFVTVTGRDGRLVTSLQQEDFQIKDEGKPQPITLFDNRPRAIRLIVMLDVSGSMDGNLPLLRAASEELFARLHPEDLVRVGTFGYDVTISPTFTGDYAELRAALPITIVRDAPTPLWHSIDTAMEAFGHEGSREPEGGGDLGENARRVIIVLSDGKDSGPQLGRRYLTEGDVIKRARKKDVMVYAIGMHSGGPRQMPAFSPYGFQAGLMDPLIDPGLEHVAEETGGGYVEIRYNQDLSAAFARVAEELHSQYLLGFAPPKRDGKVHDIDVKISKKGMKPRARKNYVAPKGA